MSKPLGRIGGWRSLLNTVSAGRGRGGVAFNFDVNSDMPTCRLATG